MIHMNNSKITSLLTLLLVKLIHFTQIIANTMVGNQLKVTFDTLHREMDQWVTLNWCFMNGTRYGQLICDKVNVFIGLFIE